MSQQDETPSEKASVELIAERKELEGVVQARQQARRDRKLVAVALSLAFVSVLSVAAVSLVFAIGRGEDVNKLAPALDASRSQVEYCAQPNVPKTDPKCQAPVVPAAKEIVGPQGMQGIQGPEGPPGPQGKQGIQGPPGMQGLRGLPGSSPACLLEPTRCVGKQGVPGGEGKPGIPGKNGTDGAPGKNGVDGKDGTPGKDGLPGKDGVNGKDGADGKPGADGAPGKNAYPFTFQFMYYDSLNQPVTMVCVVTDPDVTAMCAQQQ